MTIDGYIINVSRRIGISQTFNVSQADLTAEPALAAVGLGGAVNYFTNGYDTSTKGIDFVGTWRTHLLDGSMTWTLAYNYNHSKVTHHDPGVISAAQIEDVAHLAPNHRATLSANWTQGPFALNARENYYGGWVDAIDYCQTQAPGSSNCSTPLTWQHFGAKFTTDVDVSYTFARMFTLTIGANNLFNTYPDKIANSGINPIYVLTGSTADGQIYPRPGGPFGINGGFYYAKLRVKLGEGARVRAAACAGASAAAPAGDANLPGRQRDRGRGGLPGPAAATAASATAASARSGARTRLTSSEPRIKGRAAPQGAALFLSAAAMLKA